jgi:hypothetical protein
MNRAEHLQWCKDRALKYVDMGDYPQALISMVADLQSHTEIEGHAGLELGTALMMTGNLNTPEKMRKFINGFH